MADSKLSWIPALIAALGGAKGCILLASTVAASLGTCTYQVSAKQEQIEATQNQVAAVAESYHQVIVETTKPVKPSNRCPDKCKKYIDAEIYRLEEEYHK